MSTSPPRLPITAADLMSLLPHRHPLVLLDLLTELEPGVRAVGLKNITISDPIFAGHFPGEPIYPGVLLIEVASHVAGLVHLGAALSDGADSSADDGADDGEDAAPAGRNAYMAQVKKFRMRRTVHPGDQVVIEAKAVRRHGDLGEFDVTLRVGRDTVANGSIAIAFPPQG